MKPHYTNTSNPIDFPKSDNKMNERIHTLAEEAGLYCDGTPDAWDQEAIERFAELIVRQCADICLEMAAKCGGIPGDGALAKDCAYWIKKDFEVEE